MCAFKHRHAKKKMMQSMILFCHCGEATKKYVPLPSILESFSKNFGKKHKIRKIKTIFILGMTPL